MSIKKIEQGTCYVCGEYFYKDRFDDEDRFLASYSNSTFPEDLECNVCHAMTANERMLHERLVLVETRLGIREEKPKYTWDW